MYDTYLGLGGNIGDTRSIFNAALDEIAKLARLVKVSRFHQTKAVSDIPQRDYLNAACHIQTDLDPWTLFRELEKIERKLGKEPKPKNAPRKIDIDILFYGNETICKDGLIIPHPRWRERLFVIIPLLELFDLSKIAVTQDDVLHAKSSSERLLCGAG